MYIAPGGFRVEPKPAAATRSQRAWSLGAIESYGYGTPEVKEPAATLAAVVVAVVFHGSLPIVVVG